MKRINKCQARATYRIAPESLKWVGKIILPCLAICFFLAGLQDFGTKTSFAEEQIDYKKVYKQNDDALKKAPTKYKSSDKKKTWLPFSRGVEKKEDIKEIPKGSYVRKGILQGRTPGEKEYKKDVGIKPESKKKYLATGEFKPGKNGVKEADIKGARTKPNTKQYKVLDTIKSKDIKIDKVKKLEGEKKQKSKDGGKTNSSSKKNKPKA
jgi:hypothetical protein